MVANIDKIVAYTIPLFALAVRKFMGYFLTQDNVDCHGDFAKPKWFGEQYIFKR